MPKRTILSGLRRVISRPSKRTLPRGALSRPLIARSVVVLPGAVGADQRDDLALVDAQADVLEGLDAPVLRVEALDFEQRHQPAPSRAPR